MSEFRSTRYPFIDFSHSSTCCISSKSRYILPSRLLVKSRIRLSNSSCVNIFLYFIDSKDIREHLKKIDYKFKPDEAAFAIWQSHNKPISEKHEGYEWIINNMPDMNLKERVPRAYREGDVIDSHQYHSLHYILKKLKSRGKNELQE